jgi:hypothetical protein
VSFRATRLGLADWLIGIGAVALLIDLFAVAWFAYRARYQPIAVVLARHVSIDGWQASRLLGALALLVSLTGIAVFWLQGTRRSPALPVVIATLLTPVSLVLVVGVAIRVLLDRPSVLLTRGGGNALEPRVGAYFGLALSVAVFVGLYLSLRREGVAEEDAPASVEAI